MHLLSPRHHPTSRTSSLQQFTANRFAALPFARFSTERAVDDPHGAPSHLALPHFTHSCPCTNNGKFCTFCHTVHVICLLTSCRTLWWRPKTCALRARRSSKKQRHLVSPYQPRHAYYANHSANHLHLPLTAATVVANLHANNFRQLPRLFAARNTHPLLAFTICFLNKHAILNTPLRLRELIRRPCAVRVIPLVRCASLSRQLVFHTSLSSIASLAEQVPPYLSTSAPMSSTPRFATPSPKSSQAN